MGHRHQTFSSTGELISETVVAFTADEMRSERDQKLLATDWWAVSDRTMTSAQQQYRNLLRAVPEQAGFPDDISWPTKP